MRSDGWVKRAADELRRLEGEAEGELLAEGSRWSRWLHGFDPATGPDRQVFRCGCGFFCETLEDLATHAIRGHRWPEGDGTL